MDETKYKVRLSSPAEREAKLRANREASTTFEAFYDFRNQKTPLKVVRVDIHLPIYRTENFRTFTDQKEYTLREHKPANYFQTGLENETVQQLQHNILAKLARTGRAESIAPVIEVIKKEGQRERLLITDGGIVVNGNRRLAGMRELYTEDPSANAAFSHVDCMVLPEDATPEDIVYIEASLQAKPEVKLDYDWIGECQLINKLLGFGRTTTEIAKQLNRKEKEIRNSLQALAEADLYLKEWAKADGEYSRVRDAEQLFKDLPTLLQGKDTNLEEGSRVIAWSLYDKREELGTRLYSFNIAFGKKAADVLDRVATDLGISLDEGSVKEGNGEYAVALEEDEAATSYNAVIDALRDPERRDEVLDVLIDASRGVIESEKGSKSENAALKAVTLAHGKLSEVDLSRAGRPTYEGIDKQLDSILKKASELKAKLALYRAEKTEEK